MIDIKATFCFFYQRDHKDRERNLNVNLKFLLSNYSNIEIFVIQQLIDEGDYYVNGHLPVFRSGNIFHYPLGQPTDNWNKMSAYNFGLRYASNDVIFFNDVDTIFNPDNIERSYKLIKEEDKLMIPSGVQFIDIKSPVIDEFSRSFDYNYILSEFKEFDKLGERENTKFIRNNVGGVGGGISGRVNTFKKNNGFNPNFIGWGYEDDETKLRYLKLGFPLEFLPDGDPIFHMYHRDAKRGTALCKYLDHNKQILEDVREMDDEQLKEYNNSWKL